jgi:hypothetical protein
MTIPRITLLCSALLLTACAPSRKKRIAENAAYFQSLPPQQQVLIQKGNIALGMSRDAVRLALGKPARIVEGQQNGRSLQMWIYQGHQQVYLYSTGPSLGCYGYDRFAWGGYGPSVAHIPYVKARVQFTNGKVSAWTDSRSPR